MKHEGGDGRRREETRGDERREHPPSSQTHHVFWTPVCFFSEGYVSYGADHIFFWENWLFSEQWWRTVHVSSISDVHKGVESSDRYQSARDISLLQRGWVQTYSWLMFLLFCVIIIINKLLLISMLLSLLSSHYYNWRAPCKPALNDYFVAIFQVAPNRLKFGMSTLFVLKNVPVFFPQGGSKASNTFLKVHPPCLLTPPPPPSSISLQ